MRTLTLIVLALAALVAVPTAARGQAAPGQLIESARTRLDELEFDSAIVLLRRAVAPATGAGVRERLRAQTLLGIAFLSKGQRAEALDAFRQALALDPGLSVDSLSALQTDLVSTFNAERVAMQRTRQLSVALDAPPDTTVPLEGGGFRFSVLPTAQAMVTVTLRADTGEVVSFADSQLGGGVSSWAEFDWGLRGPDSRLVQPGRYVLSVVARDSSGQRSTPVERLLSIEVAPLDTLPWPAALAPTAFEAESLTTRERSLTPLLRGLGYGIAAGTLAYVGPTAGSPDTRAVAVGGAIAVGGLWGYLRGRVVHVPDMGAIERNRLLRQQDDLQRQAVIEQNARTRERGRLRIRTVGRGGR